MHSEVHPTGDEQLDPLLQEVALYALLDGRHVGRRDREAVSAPWNGTKVPHSRHHLQALRAVLDESGTAGRDRSPGAKERGVDLSGVAPRSGSQVVGRDRHRILVQAQAPDPLQGYSGEIAPVGVVPDVPVVAYVHAEPTVAQRREAGLGVEMEPGCRRNGRFRIRLRRVG